MPNKTRENSGSHFFVAMCQRKKGSFEQWKMCEMEWLSRHVFFRVEDGRAGGECRVVGGMW